MITNQDITTALEKAILATDTRFVVSTDEDGHADFAIDDALIRVMLNQRIERVITIPRDARELDRLEVFKTYVAPKINEFVTEFRSKAKRVVVTVLPEERRDPTRETFKGRNAGVHLGVSSMVTANRDLEFTIEMKFGTFRI